MRLSLPSAIAAHEIPLIRFSPYQAVVKTWRCKVAESPCWQDPCCMYLNSTVQYCSRYIFHWTARLTARMLWVGGQVVGRVCAFSLRLCSSRNLWACLRGELPTAGVWGSEGLFVFRCIPATCPGCHPVFSGSDSSDKLEQTLAECRRKQLSKWMDEHWRVYSLGVY